MPPSPTIVLYRRAGCHLCDEARAILDAILAARADGGLVAPAVVERDIDADDELRGRFTTTIPVVEIGDDRLELAISARQLRRFVETALAEEPTTA
ncbi:MAG TPA: glutaredoxin family protein [Candidatus Limnocylindrales bacterium]